MDLEVQEENTMQELTVAIPYRPSFTRTLIKTASYKLFALIAMLGIMYFSTHSIAASLTVGGLDLVVKTIIYIVHERVWAHIDTGKLPPVQEPDAAL